MSEASSNAASWFARFDSPLAYTRIDSNDDPRLGALIQPWNGDETAVTPGRAVIVGFPQEEGVRRNNGRIGTAQAPQTIRRFLHLLCPADGSTGVDLARHAPLDVGDLQCTADLESDQLLLSQALAWILARKAVPVVLGGGHETAFGHYLAYALLKETVGIINIDAHLDVRPMAEGKGHSGSPFRQALDYAAWPLKGSHYVCLGTQPHAVSRRHLNYVTEHGGKVHWAEAIRGRLASVFQEEYDRLAADECHVYVTFDADAVSQFQVPGVSAPNAAGLDTGELLECLRLAGSLPRVASVDIVEVNPRLDFDNHASRWAALALWQILMGLAQRPVI